MESHNVGSSLRSRSENKRTVGQKPHLGSTMSAKTDITAPRSQKLPMVHLHTHEHDCDRNIEQVSENHDCAHQLGIGRREFVLAGGPIVSALLSGCWGGQSDDGQVADPVSLAGTRQCDVCGMVISEHPGPTGQIFYQENTPETHGNPAWFDSPKACLLPYYFEQQHRDWTAEVVYVTDYSKVDYEISEREGTKYIETATAPETFSKAEDVVFVIESEVHGAMGPDFIPFSDEDDGDSFANEFGGQTLTMDDITPELLSR